MTLQELKTGHHPDHKKDLNHLDLSPFYTILQPT